MNDTVQDDLVHKAVQPVKSQPGNDDQFSQRADLFKEKAPALAVLLAAAGADAFIAFVTAVNEQLGLQHRHWIEASQGVKSMLSTLDAALATAIKGKADKTQVRQD